MTLGFIDSAMEELMRGGPGTTIDRARMSDGPPLFNKEDIRKSQNELDVSLRYIFDHMKIGKSYLGDKATDYYQSIAKHGREKAKSDTQNLVRTLEKGDITFNRYSETMRCLGWDLIDLSVTVKDDVGEIHTFSTAEARRELEEGTES